MGVMPGHRNVVPLKLGHRNGLSVLTNRHGIPFYSPAEIGEVIPPFDHSLIFNQITQIVFSLSGALSGRKEFNSGETEITFNPVGNLRSGKVIPDESRMLKVDTMIHFWQSGTPKKYHVLKGNPWIVFDVPGTLAYLMNQFNRRGEALIQFILPDANLRFFRIYNGYGGLYSWYVVDYDVDGETIAPDGWSVPGYMDWWNLMKAIDPDGTMSVNDAGGKIKAIGTDFWKYPNTGADNSTGFNAKGSGVRDSTGLFSSIRREAWFISRDGITPPYDFGYYGGGILTSSDAKFNAIASIFAKTPGQTIRLVRNSTTLSIGQTGSMTDYDNNKYPTICMPDGKEWMAEHLAVTHYNRGTPIPLHQRMYEWIEGVGTAQMCFYRTGRPEGAVMVKFATSAHAILLSKYYISGVADITFDLYNLSTKYGLLYNHFVLEDERGIAGSGWHVWTDEEITWLGSEGSLKETGFGYWGSPNTGATNITKFHGRGGGYRSSGQNFWNKTTYGFWWAVDVVDSTHGRSRNMNYDRNSGFMYSGSDYKEMGMAVRLIADNTSLAEGETGWYYGNDGRVYKTVCINGLEVIMENLVETRYCNYDDIPEVTDRTDWFNLTEGALCAYDNDWNNV